MSETSIQLYSTACSLSITNTHTHTLISFEFSPFVFSFNFVFHALNLFFGWKTFSGWLFVHSSQFTYDFQHFRQINENPYIKHRSPQTWTKVHIQCRKEHKNRIGNNVHVPVRSSQDLRKVDMLCRLARMNRNYILLFFFCSGRVWFDLKSYHIDKIASNWGWAQESNVKEWTQSSAEVYKCCSMFIFHWTSGSWHTRVNWDYETFKCACILVKGSWTIQVNWIEIYWWPNMWV